MATGTKHVVIVQGHPEPQHRHFCHALADAYAAGAREAGHDVEIIDVARLDFPLARSREDLERRPTPEAIRQVQDALTKADHVVLFYPVWNGAMPALLKGFLEQTFRSSFVFPDAKPDERLGFSSSYFSLRKALSERPVGWWRRCRRRHLCIVGTFIRIRRRTRYVSVVSVRFEKASSGLSRRLMVANVNSGSRK